MTPLFKPIFFAVALLLLQISHIKADEAEESDPNAAPSEPEAETEKQGPLTMDELQFTRLSELNKVAKSLDKGVKDGQTALTKFDESAAKIKPLRSPAAVNAVVEKSLGEKNGIFKKETAKIKMQLCLLANRFKKQLKSVISLTELLADTERPSLSGILKAEDATQVDEAAKQLSKLKPSEKDSKELNDEIIQKNVKESDYPNNLYGKKNLAYKKIHVIEKYYVDSLESMKEGINYGLNAYLKALLAVKDIQREVKSTQQYPENIDQLEKDILKAVAVSNSLGCFKKDKSKVSPAEVKTEEVTPEGNVPTIIN